MDDKTIKQFADILSKMNSGSSFTQKDKNNLMSMFGNNTQNTNQVLTDDQRYEQIRQKKIKNEKISEEDQKFYKKEIDLRLKNKCNNMKNNRSRNNYHSRSVGTLNVQQSNNRSNSSNMPIDPTEMQNLLATMLNNTDLLAQAGINTSSTQVSIPDPDVEPIVVDSSVSENLEQDENLDDYLLE